MFIKRQPLSWIVALFLLDWVFRDMGFKSEVAYPYLVCKARNPGLKGWNVGLKVLYLGVACIVVEGGEDGGYDVFH